MILKLSDSEPLHYKLSDSESLHYKLPSTYILSSAVLVSQRFEFFLVTYVFS